MTPPPALRLALLLGPVLFLAACGASGQQGSAQELNRRLQTRLAADIASGHVAVTPIADGAQVTLLDLPPYIAPPELGPRDTYLLTSVVEGLLDPSLMRIAVADTAPVPPGASRDRAGNATRFLATYNLGPSLTQPTAVVNPPAGLAVAITVQCPDGGPAYRAYGTPTPTCN